MSGAFAEAAVRIRGELPRLDGEVREAVHALSRARYASEDSDLFIKAAALSLHGFYSALERLFEQIARHVDARMPSGSAWHRDLLLQMAQDSPGVWPAVLSTADASFLQAYLGFRHVVRNVYTDNLSVARIGDLVEPLPDAWSGIRDRLVAFASLLEATP